MSRRNLNIDIYENGKKRNLILMHGWGFDNNIWQPLVPELSKFFNLYLVDLPGFGLSNLMHWEDFKSSLIDIIPENYILIGWSLGGLFSTRLVLEEIPGVTHLINLTSSPKFIEDIKWPGVSSKIFQNFYKNLRADTEKALLDFVNLQFRSTVPNDNFKFKIPSKVALERGLQVLETWDLRDSLKSIKIPVCYYFGRLDAIVPARILPVMKKDFPNFHYVLFKQASHAPFLSHTEQFISALMTFVDEN